MGGALQTALITGGTGNLGRLVAERLLAAGQRVIKFDLPGGGQQAPGANETVVHGDIRDRALLDGLVAQHRPDCIYHLASLLSGSSEADPEAAWEINASASFALLDCARRHGVGKFFFASTAASYGPVDADPMPLDYPQWPENIYGATKVAVERLGVYFRQKHGLDFRCLRFPLVISPWAPKTAVSAYPSQAFRAAHRGEAFSFPIAADTGISTIFLDDVIDSIVDYVAADAARLGVPVYNLHAFHLSGAMVAEAVTARYPDFDFRFEPVTEIDHLIASWPGVVDDSAARRDWGWNPRFDLDAAADRMCELLRLENTK